MKVILKRAAILTGIFLLAIAGYFLWFQKEETPKTLYTSLEEAEFPILSVDMLGREMNYLHGYKNQIDISTMRETLTVLPKDRKLKINVEENKMKVQEISYEIRSLDGERLIERTEVSEWNKEEDGRITAALPIQNLLTKDREYMLSVILHTNEEAKIYYNTRIVLTDASMVQEMLDLAFDFSERTFDSQQAAGLAMYLETDKTANSTSLGNVTIRSSFAQLTWGNLNVTRTSPVYAVLAELNGNLSTVRLRYLVESDTEEGESEVFEVSEDFTMRWSAQRIYMMDYNRSMNQVFSGEENLFSGKRIVLGISDGQNLQVLSSASKKYTAFLVKRDLWSYDGEKNRAFKIFSFQDGNTADFMANAQEHQIKILRTSDEGNVDFLVYGYMNRGEHEGQCGVTYYQYDNEKQILRERFFTNSAQSYENLWQDVERLSYLSSKDVLYLYHDHGIYAIDLISGEYVVIADALTDDSFCVSADKTMLAWQGSTDILQSDVIHLMNLETGEKREIIKEDKSLLRTLGFVGNDVVYGLAREEDLTYICGQLFEVPMYALEVAEEDTTIAAHYEKTNIYLTDVVIDGSRIHMMCSSKDESSRYVKQHEDTLISNEELEEERMDGVGWYASNTKGRVYFVSLPSEIAQEKSLSYKAPKRVEKDMENDLELRANNKISDMAFRAYAGGKLLGKYTRFSDAVQAAYEHMGVVTDQKQNVLWMRGNRSASRTIRDPQAAFASYTHGMEEFDGSGIYGDSLLLDGRDCSLEQVLFYVDRGYPVAVVEDSENYSLLFAYDSSSVQLYSPQTGSINRMSIEDAETYFSRLGNNYVCPFFTNG